MNQIKIIEWEDRFAEDFVTLSREWLEKYLRMEPVDYIVLYQPYEAVLKDGGMIFFANDGEKNVGTVAMKNMGDGVFELIKLGVTESYKRQHIGDHLVEAAIAYGERCLAKKIVLFSSSVLAPALALYEKHGFVHVPMEANEFEDADVQMELELTAWKNG
ncbi:MAG: GNAT family N-acetyltransferase [Lachnospiraceae bacterium]|nr:GNAT family N-acetyltransferase [Lachnospiraceae bacterium]